MKQSRSEEKHSYRIAIQIVYLIHPLYKYFYTLYCLTDYLLILLVSIKNSDSLQCTEYDTCSTNVRKLVAQVYKFTACLPLQSSQRRLYKDMGRKKKKYEEEKPWCFYCDREFDDEKILIQHQRAKVRERERVLASEGVVFFSLFFSPHPTVRAVPVKQKRFEGRKTSLGLRTSFVLRLRCTRPEANTPSPTFTSSPARPYIPSASPCSLGTPSPPPSSSSFRSTSNARSVTAS